MAVYSCRRVQARARGPTSGSEWKAVGSDARVAMTNSVFFLFFLAKYLLPRRLSEGSEFSCFQVTVCQVVYPSETVRGALVAEIAENVNT